MKNRYYISYVKETDEWNIIDYRNRKVVYEGSKEMCISILEDLKVKTKGNVDLKGLLKEEGYEIKKCI